MKVSKILLSLIFSICSSNTFAMYRDAAAPMDIDETISAQQAEQSFMNHQNAHLFISLIAYENIYGPMYAEKVRLIINSAPMYSYLVESLTQEASSRRPNFRKRIDQAYQALMKRPRQ